MGEVRLSLVPVSDGRATRRRPPYFATKKLALIGATTSKVHAPWTDRTWTIAAHACTRADYKREPDWYFDMHRPECFRTQAKGWHPAYYTWLTNLQTPIFMQEDWPDIPMAVRYPIERITAEFRSSGTGRLYATNHVAYLIALAMTEGVETIGLFGCQYSADTEHGVQRGSCEYWLGRFEQNGGRIVLAAPNNLLASPKGLYGYESHDAQGKLLPDYRPRLIKPAGSAVTDFVPIDLTKADGRPPLATPPDGEAIAWDRSGHVLHV